MQKFATNLTAYVENSPPPELQTLAHDTIHNQGGASAKSFSSNLLKIFGLACEMEPCLHDRYCDNVY